MHFYVDMTFLSIDCPFCPVKCRYYDFLIPDFLQYIVHSFCSIIRRSLFTLFCHISFHRKKIHYPLLQHWCMFSGLYDTGMDGGEHFYIVSVEARLSGSGDKQKRKHFSKTHMYTVCILIILFSYFFNVGAGPQRADTAVSDNPKAQRPNIHIQLSVWWAVRILQSVSVLP